LRLWDLADSQIDALATADKASEFIDRLSPVSGTVVEKNLVDGSARNAGELLYRIADLSQVWVEAHLYEADLGAVRVGQRAEVTLPYMPDARFSGTVSYVYPYLDADSRTMRARLEVPNPTGALKPDMFANVALEIPYGEQLVVPDGAVVMAGDTNVVFVDMGEGKLKPRKVKIGRRTPSGYIVLDGLAEGDTVVTSGTFLIAAESKLKAGLEKW
jgi:Cu(I)/Ag(I) efflux system membrane fusion protein